MKKPPTPQQSPGSHKPPTFWQIMHSVVAAAFGAQGDESREQDFSGKPWHYVVVGVTLTLTLALLLVGIAQLILHVSLP
jgi:hypothetical protein